MELIDTPKIKRLNQLLNQAQLQEHKADLVQSFSATKATSSKELLMAEATALIRHLESYVERLPVPPKGTEKEQAADKMRKKMIYYAYEMKWTINSKIDMERLNNWCERYGQYKKKLNAHTNEELAKLVSQFERVYKSFLLGSVKL